MTVEIKTSAAVSLNFDKVQGLRDLKDTALSLSAYCKAGSEVIEALQEVAGADFQGTWSLTPFLTRLRGHCASVSVLTDRIGNTIELVSAEQGKVQVFGLIANEVCVCTRLEESVYSCRYQQPCVSTRRKDHQRHDSCEVDYIFNPILSAR